MKFKNKILSELLKQSNKTNIKTNTISINQPKQLQTNNKILKLIFNKPTKNHITIKQLRNHKPNRIDLNKYINKKHQTIWKKHARFVNHDVNTFNKNTSNEVDNDFNNWDETMQKKVVSLAMDWGRGSLSLPENAISAKGTSLDFLKKFADELVGDVKKFKYQDKQGLEAFNMALKQIFKKYGI